MAASPFMEGLRRSMLVRHYSKRTIDSYLYWIRYYIRFSGRRHPAELDQEQVMAFLTFLAEQRLRDCGNPFYARSGGDWWMRNQSEPSAINQQ